MSSQNNRHEIVEKNIGLLAILIVVAIIGVMIAIAIPTFSGALTRANQGVDDANIRSAYAQHKMTVMLDGEPSNDDTKLTPAEAKAVFDTITSGGFKYYTSIDSAVEPWVGKK